MTIREAKPDDAEQIIAHVLRIADEPNKMVVVGPGEFKVTLEQEREILAEHARSDNSIYLVAELEGRIVGILHCNGGKRAANRHNAALGMSIRVESRNQGVGSALLSYLIDWAESTAVLSRLELETYAHNEAAIHLYGKFGFSMEGRRVGAYYQDGRYIDGILMARLWTPYSDLKALI